jgi:tetratricopeptide (TPR) repeat protein
MQRTHNDRQVATGTSSTGMTDAQAGAAVDRALADLVTEAMANAKYEIALEYLQERFVLRRKHSQSFGWKQGEEDNADLMAQLAACYAGLHDLYTASILYEHLMTALGSNPDVSAIGHDVDPLTIRIVLARIYKEQEQYDDAEELLQVGVEKCEAEFQRTRDIFLSPRLDGTQARIALARIYAEVGRDDEAEELLWEGAESWEGWEVEHPAPGMLRMALADLYEQRGELEKTISFVESEVDSLRCLQRLGIENDPSLGDDWLAEDIAPHAERLKELRARCSERVTAEPAQSSA